MPITDPPDIDLEVYKRIWDVLTGYQPWMAEFEEGNLIRFDRDASNTDPEKMHRADGDYPEAKLELTGGSSTGFISDEQFGTWSEDGPCNWTESQGHAYRLTVTSETLSALEESDLRRLTLNGLRLAGPRLGVEEVTKVSWRWSVVRQPSGDDDGMFRQIITIDIAVETLTEGRRLTGEVP